MESWLPSGLNYPGNDAASPCWIPMKSHHLPRQGPFSQQHSLQGFYLAEVCRQALSPTRLHERKAKGTPRLTLGNLWGCGRGQLSTAAFFWLEFSDGDRFPSGRKPEHGLGARTPYLGPDLILGSTDSCCTVMNLLGPSVWALPGLVVGR